MNEEQIREYLIQKMAEAWKANGSTPPTYQGPPIPELIGGNSDLRNHPEGITSLRCGRSVAYFFPLDNPLVRHEYERMEEHARRGLLQSSGSLSGMMERHELSGVEESIAHLVTTAERSSHS